MDLESYRRWYDYSKARDLMLKATDSKHAPWHIVRTDDKRRGRLNCISHILSRIPYKKIPRDKVKLPKRAKEQNTTTRPRSRAGISLPNDIKEMPYLPGPNTAVTAFMTVSS